MYTVRRADGEFEKKLRGKFIVCRREKDTQNWKKIHTTISGYRNREVADIVAARLNAWPQTMRRFAQTGKI